MKNDDVQNVLTTCVASLVAVAIVYPFDGSRLYRQNVVKRRITIDGRIIDIAKNYSFWKGFKHALKFNATNLKALGVGLARAPLSTALCHSLYMSIQKFDRRTLR
eukprot:TRINITY_DN8116_c0_g1_i1.p2 TRINITY_DN8116_c0_g1~~TRINITY_DN8116_c0_g1_i1.p2  ORF type:complete len:105 (-),score=15.47 TRINITY_DN8116_c0_g1_i1:4-318(-)